MTWRRSRPATLSADRKANPPSSCGPRRANVRATGPNPDERIRAMPSLPHPRPVKRTGLSFGDPYRVWRLGRVEVVESTTIDGVAIPRRYRVIVGGRAGKIVS